MKRQFTRFSSREEATRVANLLSRIYPELKKAGFEVRKLSFFERIYKKRLPFYYAQLKQQQQFVVTKDDLSAAEYGLFYPNGVNYFDLYTRTVKQILNTVARLPEDVQLHCIKPSRKHVILNNLSNILGIRK